MTIDQLDALLDQAVDPNPGAPEIHLSFGGVPLTLRCQSPGLAGRIGELYARHLQSAAQAKFSDGERAILDLYELGPKSQDTYSLLWDENSPPRAKNDRFYGRDFAAEKISRLHVRAILSPQIDQAIPNLLGWYLPSILIKTDADFEAETNPNL